MTEFEDRVQLLLQAEPNPTLNYYALTIFLGDAGVPEYSCFTGWVGYTEDTPRREIREASLVHADRMLRSWRTLDEPGMVVETPSDFWLFFSFGGHAVVERHLAESVVPEWLAPRPSVNVGEWGFAAPGCLPEAAMRRAPTPKLRMQIIKRDNFGCRVCGRSPSDYGDLELHVHHIRPWAAGGVTEESNLITLCHTCHNGLDPHFESGLFRLLRKEISDRAERYRRKLAAYQAAAAVQSGEADV